MNDTELKNDSDWQRGMGIYEKYMNSANFDHVAVVEGVALVGLFIMFSGYKYIRFAMFNAGFGVACCLFYVFSPTFIHTQYCCDKENMNSVRISVSVAVGFLFGLLTSHLYRFGVLLIGKCLGLLLAVIVLHYVPNVSRNNKLLMTVILTVAAFVFASLAWKFEKIIIIISTSCIGCFMALCGVDIFIRSNFSLAVISILLYIRDGFMFTVVHGASLPSAHLPKLRKIEHQNTTGFVFVAGWVLLSLFSVVVQYNVTCKHTENGGKIFPCRDALCESLFPCYNACSAPKVQEKK